MLTNRFVYSVIGTLLFSFAMMAQSTGTVDYGGTIPTTFKITNTSNGDLADTSALQFGTLTIGASGSNPLVTKSLAFRLRSNAGYKLSASVGSLVNIATGSASAASTTAQDIKLGDIGFGFSAAIDKSGASVVNGGGSPTRTDTITSGFDVTTGSWPSVSNGHTPAFTKTLNDLDGGADILTGDRISASGDNSSSDNFLVVTVGVATLPQYLTAATFSGKITFTLGQP